MKAYRLFNLLIVLSLALSGVFVVPPQQVQAAVSPGAIAIIGIDTDDPDIITFVALEDIPEGEVIRFTDDGWVNTGSFRIGEGGVQWTSPSGGITAGTVVSKSSPFDSENWSVNSAGLGTGGMYFSTSGDQIIAFQGLATSPTMVYAINADSGTPKTNGWQDNATSPSTSALPTGLTEGTSAVGLFQTASEVDDAHYDCSKGTSGTKAELLALISNRENWLLSDTAYGDYSTWTGCPASFTITSAVDDPPTVSSTLPGTGATEVAVDANITVTFSEPVNLGTDWYSITCVTSGNHTAAVDETADPIIVIDPDGTFTRGESCTVILEADNILDEDGTANNLAGDYPWTFTVTPFEPAPTVTDVTPAVNAANIPLSSDITVTFSEPVDVTDGWYGITCGTKNPTAVISGGPTAFTLNPDDDFDPGTSCTVTIDPSKVSDQDTDDPENLMTAGYSWSFTTTSCGVTFTPIYTIQGSGETGMSGAVTTEGVVVSDDEGEQPALRGFYLQDLTGDGDPNTSDGIFIYNNTNNSVALGDVVRVSGTASEYNGQTQISLNFTSPVVEKCGTGTVTPTDVNLPFASATDAEKYEGMLVKFPQSLYVTEHFQLGRFGQVVLSSNAKLAQPTNIYTPGTEAQALQAANNLNRIILDDSLNSQNPDPIVFGRGGSPLSASNTLRGGDTITNLVGVMTYTWGGNSASGNAYRVRPVNALGGGVPNFQATNARPNTAPVVGGSLKVTTLNLLNYFNTFTNCTLGVGGTPSTSNCRGASNQTEFDRQWPKTVQAILNINAAVIGVAEIENDGYGATSAIQHLVNQLNAPTAPGTYAFIDADTLTGQVNALGTDAIKVGLIYKPNVVTPVGTTAALNTVEFVNGGDAAARNRPALAQAFQENMTGGRFVITVNHLKSKGSACDTPDAGDGQGNCNIVRDNAATELVQWLASDPTGTGETDILIMGDLNSYAKEDPITTIESAGYTNLISTYGGSLAYSYVFDGQWGYLDHALAFSSILPQITGVAEYHINSDEPSVLDFETDFKSAAQITSLYEDDEFRVSDHDPILVGLNLAPVTATTIWVNDDWATEPNGAPVTAGGGTHAIGYDAFATIQAGIAAAPAGSTVNVLAGTYAEHLTITKPLSLLGADKAATIIDGGGTGIVVTIQGTSNVTLSGFTIQNSGPDIDADGGIGLILSTGCTIENNIIQDTTSGIGLLGSFGNTIRNNTIDDSARYGIVLDQVPDVDTLVSPNNLVTGNTITDSGRDGIYVGKDSHGQTITNNIISGAYGTTELTPSGTPSFEGNGIYFWKSKNNTVTGNTIFNNVHYGIELMGSSGNTINGNTLYGNLDGMRIRASGYPAGAYPFYPFGIGANTISGNAQYNIAINIPLDLSDLPLPDVLQDVLDLAPYGSTILVPGSTQAYAKTGAFTVNNPGITVILQDEVVIENASPCFVVNADYTTLKADTIGGAQCVPTSNSNGIDVTGTRTDLTIEGIEFVGTAGTDGIHFAGGITDTLIIDNFIHNFSGAGLFFSAQPAGEVRIQGNLFKDNTGNGIEAGTFNVLAEYNSWGHIDGAAAGDEASANVDADPWTHVDLYMTSSGSPWANQVVTGQTITYTVYGNLENAFGADVTLVYPANLTLIPASLTNLGTFNSLASFDTTVPNTIQFYGIGTGYAAQSGTARPIFSAQFTAATPGAALPMNLDETSDGFAMNIDADGYSNNIYANDLLNGGVTIIDLPTLTSLDLVGPYVQNIPQTFTLTITNPATGGNYSAPALQFSLPAGTTLEYYNGSTWVPLPATIPAITGSPTGSTTDLLFRVTFSVTGSQSVTVTLVDTLSTDPGNTTLATLTQAVNIYQNLTVTGTFSMQGRSTRLGIPVTLTATILTYGPFNASTINQISDNITFSNVVADTYLITTNQPRYLDVIAILNITKVIDASNTTISALMLRGGDADDNNHVYLGDASIIGSNWGSIVDNNGDVNYSGKVDIFDLALVGGNYSLTSAQAYAGDGGLFPAWVP